jgi:hypothetical protein
MYSVSYLKFPILLLLIIQVLGFVAFYNGEVSTFVKFELLTRDFVLVIINYFVSLILFLQIFKTNRIFDVFKEYKINYFFSFITLFLINCLVYFFEGKYLLNSEFSRSTIRGFHVEILGPFGFLYSIIKGQFVTLFSSLVLYNLINKRDVYFNLLLALLLLAILLQQQFKSALFWAILPLFFFISDDKISYKKFFKVIFTIFFILLLFIFINLRFFYSDFEFTSVISFLYNRLTVQTVEVPLSIVEKLQITENAIEFNEYVNFSISDFFGKRIYSLFFDSNKFITSSQFISNLVTKDENEFLLSFSNFTPTFLFEGWIFFKYFAFLWAIIFFIFFKYLLKYTLFSKRIFPFLFGILFYGVFISTFNSGPLISSFQIPQLINVSISVFLFRIYLKKVS